MAKLTRKTQKIFADSAAASQITAFGSIKANSPNPPVYSKDPDIIQSNEFLQGWSGATQDDYAPYRQDMNAIQNLVTRQLAYLFQAGIPEYDSSTQYFANCSFCQYNGNLYLCIQDALNKNPSTEPTYWKIFDLSGYAPLNSPAFTGTPTAPTPDSTDNSTKIATTAFVKSLLGSYAPTNSPAFTGTPTAPTPDSTDNSTKIATTAFIKSLLGSYAPTNSPAFTGTPTAPTQTAGNNSTRLATTAWVQSWANNNSTSSLSSWSKGQNGYFKFKNGLIIQWGRVTSLSSGQATITLPTPFTTAYSVSGTCNYIAPTSSGHGYVSDVSLTSFKCRGVDADMVPWFWVAVGY